MRVKIITLLCLLTQLVFGQTTVELPASADAMLLQAAGHQNMGGEVYMETYPRTPSYSKRFVIKFDLSSIPSNATITSANLILAGAVSYGQTRTIAAHAVTQSWQENTVNWDNTGTAYQTTASATHSLSHPTSTTGTWDLTADVQAFINGTSTNNGWLFKDNNEDASEAFWRFTTKEGSTESHRPKLVVEYEEDSTSGPVLPEPVPYTINLSAVEDARIEQYTGGNNFGSDTILSVHPWEPNFNKRTLVKFNLNNIQGLPPQAIISKATLKLHRGHTLGIDKEIAVHACTESWAENSVTWNNFDNAYETTPITSTVATYVTETAISWDVTDDFVQMYYYHKENNGWLLKAQTEDNLQYFFEFFSKESAQTGKRPTLEIEYVLPEQVHFFHCELPEADEATPDVDPSYIPDANTPIKYIRVNVHFMLKEDDNNPGNFTPSHDGQFGYDYNGYLAAEQLIKRANDRLAGNIPMALPPGNSTPVLERKYRYVLSGVFFHKDDSKYDFSTHVTNFWSNPPDAYKENSTSVINIFSQEAGIYTGKVTGYAPLPGYRTVIKGLNWRYFYEEGQNIPRYNYYWVDAQNVNHEIGHNLGLNHTYLTSVSAECVFYDADGLSDTPTAQEMSDNYGINMCNPNPTKPSIHGPCGWSVFGNCSNNMMDYSGADAMTPQQLGVAHKTFQEENGHYPYTTCYYSQNQLLIQNFTTNKAYIAQNVVVPTTEIVVVDDYKGLFVNCEEFDIELGSEFEIQVGSQFWVNLVPKCN